MNLDDLRAELDARANDVGTNAHGRLAGIRAKAAQRRRRQAGAAVSAAVLAVGVIVGVPVVTQLSDGPEPAETTGPFPDEVNGDTLIASEVADKGDKSVTLEFTPDDAEFLLDFRCDVQAKKYSSPRARINGKSVWTGCDLGAFSDKTSVYPHQLGSVSTPEQVADRWSSKYDIDPGEPVTITLTVRNPGKMHLGVAAYEMTGDRVMESGVALSTERTVGDRTYRLAESRYDVAPPGDRRATVDVPASVGPGLASYGSAGSIWGTIGRARVDGEELASTPPVGVQDSMISGSGPHTIDIEKSPKHQEETVFAAYYTPVDADDDSPDESPFPDTVDGNSLVASEVGDQGDKQVTLAYTPDDTDVLVDYACDDIAQYNREHGTSYAVKVEVSAVPRSGVMGGFYRFDACAGGQTFADEPSRIGSGAGADRVRERWQQLGLRPGDRVRIELTVWDGSAPARGPFDGRIGAALYDMPDGDDTEPDDESANDTTGEPRGGQTDERQSVPNQPDEGLITPESGRDEEHVRLGGHQRPATAAPGPG